MTIKIDMKFDIKSAMKDINKFIKNLEKLEGETTSYGYFNGKVHSTEFDREGLTEAELMYILEFGSDEENIPARPVFRRTGEMMQDSSNSSAFKVPITNFVINACKGKDLVSKTLLDIGNIMKLVTQSNFGSNNSIGLEPNAQLTKLLKGRDDPLVHTGELRDAMEVRTSRGGKS